MTKTITPGDVAHIAALANIPVSDAEKISMAEGFTKTIYVVEKLTGVDISKAKDVHVTGLTNIFREDEVDESRMFSQKDALMNAKHTHEGYFVADRIIDEI
jgi:aspartyl/glutamyl-tRNA(Asn/Gln) amidotransferase C subunit